MEIMQKRNFYSNFDFFMKKFNLKKTDLEKEAGVSQGYLSRFMQKEDPDAFPSVSFLEYCSRKFKVSMDDLLNTKFKEMSPTEEYIYQFIKKLILETESDELLWEQTNWSTIKKNIEDDYRELCGSIWNEFTLESSIDFERSQFEPDAVDIVFQPARKLRYNSVICQDVFSTCIREEIQADLFLIPITYYTGYTGPDYDPHSEITLWMGRGDGYQRQLRCIARGGEEDFNLLYPILERFLAIVKERQKHIQVEKNLKILLVGILIQMHLKTLIRIAIAHIKNRLNMTN